MSNRRTASVLLVAVIMLGTGSCSALQAQQAEPAGETRAPAEWREYYLAKWRQSQTEWLEIARDPDKWRQRVLNETRLDYLKRCCVLTCQSCERLGVITELTGNRAKCIRDYWSWLQADGSALALKWLAGEGLTPEQEEYIPLLKAVCITNSRILKRGVPVGSKELLIPKKARSDYSEFDRACARYESKVGRLAEPLFARVLLGKRLTRKETEILAARALKMFLLNGGGMLPSHNPLLQHDKLQVKFGEKFDFRALRMDVALNSPHFADEYPRDPYAIFRPEAAIAALTYASQWVAKKDAEGKNYVAPKPLPSLDKEDPDYFRLSAHLKKSAKPLLLFAFDANDNCGSEMIWAASAALHHAYGDRVDFLMLNTIIGESSLSGEHYFGPPMDYSRVGTVGLEIPGHALTLEDRARTAKNMKYITWPNIPFPCVLDNMGCTTFWQLRPGIQDGGKPCAILFDREGRTVYAAPNAFPVYFTGWGSTPRATLFANEVELALQKILQNDGLYDGKPPKGLNMESGPYWIHPYVNKFKDDLGIVDTGLIVELDKEQAIVTVELRDPGDWNIKKGTKVQVHLGRTRLCGFRSTEPIDLADLRPGDDLVRTQCYNPKDKPNEIHATFLIVHNRLSRPLTKPNGERFWASGHVEAVHARGRTITVMMARPDTEKMQGYRFIKEGLGQDSAQGGGNITLWGLGKDNWERVNACIARGGKPYTLKVAKTTEVYLNGRLADLKDLRKRDALSFTFEDGTELPDAGYTTDSVRASRMDE